MRAASRGLQGGQNREFCATTEVTQGRFQLHTENFRGFELSERERTVHRSECESHLRGGVRAETVQALWDRKVTEIVLSVTPSKSDIL